MPSIDRSRGRRATPESDVARGQRISRPVLLEVGVVDIELADDRPTCPGHRRALEAAESRRGA